MAGYESGAQLQKTFLVTRGQHAYFFDRWWQQRAILDYFKALLPGALLDPAILQTPTVNQTLGGASFSSQLVDLGNPTPAQADALQGPLVCPAGPTAVTVVSLGGRRYGGGVVVRWRTASEAGILGFDLYRLDGPRRVRVNRRLVPARGRARTPSAGYAYLLRDRHAGGEPVRYVLEQVSADGRRTAIGTATVR